jgi:hypothetical protein
MHNNILIVEISDTLSLYEKTEHEILGNNFSYCKKYWLDDFNQLPESNKKIAVIGANYVLDCFDISRVPTINLSRFDLLIIFDIEILPGDDPEEYLELTRERFSIKNVIIVTGAIKQNLTLTTDKIFIFPLFLIEASCDYTYTETGTEPKLKLFDALLGIYKPHRATIVEALRTTNLLDKSYVSLVSLNNLDYLSNKSTIYYSPELHTLEQPQAVLAKELNNGVFNSYQATFPHPTVPHIVYPISRQLPVGVYQNSYYSIVAETQWNSFIFFTEKTVKPLLAKRLFVMFSAYHHLKKLREYGFKTFGDIIDESYDNEVDDDLRIAKAVQQIINLSKMDPTVVQKTIKDTVEHNYAIITNRELLILPLRNWLLSHIHSLS